MSVVSSESSSSSSAFFSRFLEQCLGVCPDDLRRSSNDDDANVAAKSASEAVPKEKRRNSSSPSPSPQPCQSPKTDSDSAKMTVFDDDYLRMLDDSGRLSLDEGDDDASSNGPPAAAMSSSSLSLSSSSKLHSDARRNKQHADRRDTSNLLGPISVPAEYFYSAALDSPYGGDDDRTDVDELRWLTTPAEVRSVRTADFREKELWFASKCNCLEVGRRRRGSSVRIDVNAGTLLEDGMDAVLGMRRDELRRAWDVVLLDDEPQPRAANVGDGASGALAREWFALVTQSVCDVGRGLWRNGKVEDVGLQINPWSGMIHADHLDWYRFLGRVMGKALFDGIKLPNAIIPYIYKFLVGAPLSLLDLKQCDRRYYDFVKTIEALAVEGGNDDGKGGGGDDDGADAVADLGLNFTLTEEDPFGGETYVELLPGGADVQLTRHNLGLYKECLVRYLLIDRLRPQLTELFGGIHEVVPKQLLSVFESHELEIMMCGSLGISHLQVPE